MRKECKLEEEVGKIQHIIGLNAACGWLSQNSTLNLIDGELAVFLRKLGEDDKNRFFEALERFYRYGKLIENVRDG